MKVFIADAATGATILALAATADILRGIWRDRRKTDDWMALADATHEQHERVATTDELAAVRQRRGRS